MTGHLVPLLTCDGCQYRQVPAGADVPLMASRGGAPMSATELTRSDADENLDACRVRCHVCGARVYVGETAHDVEPGDDGVERFACAEHCEVCR